MVLVHLLGQQNSWKKKREKNCITWWECVSVCMAEQELEDETIKINGAGKEANQKKRKIPQTEQF